VKRKEIGLAVIGSGRIGTLRAKLAAKHPSVKFLAVSDIDINQAKKLAEATGAGFYSTNNDEVIARPEVNAVIVSTPEGEHVAAVRKALELGKPVMVEKPIALTLNDADDILAALKDYGGELRIGYSRRYKECFLRAKEQMIQGRLGKVIGGTARVYNSRAQAFNILERDPHATPVLDILTYYVDLMCWFMEGNPPVEVIARGNKEIFKGYEADDMIWAIVTFASGAIVNFGVCYALPTNYPTQGQSDRVELIGTDGCMIIDDDHLDQIIYSDKGIPGTYLADRKVNLAFLGSNSGGEWAVGDFWGPLANETRAWLDHLVTGAPTVQTTPEQGRVNLETTIAIVRAVESGMPVRLPLET
jgi:predicted dehydrogenase